MSHIGIELRVRIPSGTIVQSTSDFLYMIAKYSYGTADWTELLHTVDGLVIDIKPMELSNPDLSEDDEEDLPEVDEEERL